jgi:peptidoglycan hydrolase-like protein with peptidoglycan-binding domain
MSAGGRRRRRTGRALVAVTAVLAAGAATVAATGSSLGLGAGLGLRSDEASGSERSELPPATAQVTRQTLVDTETVSGELGYGDTTTVSGRLGGTVTWLPAVGATVKQGQALYRVDDSPVVLLYGALPAYRPLAPGVEGADVKQFEQNLRALGYTGFTVDDEYSDATADAVREWQDELGLAETGTVEPGRIVYASGAVRVDSRKASVGGQAQGDVLSYTGTARVVIVELDVDDQRMARTGATVSVTLPDGKSVAGKIAETETVVDTGSNSDSPGADQEPTTKLEVTVTVDDEKSLAGLDQASVDVGFTASEREDVLTVPVAALLALAEGGYGIQIVDGDTTRTVAVQTGLFAAGRVEVSGADVTEGLTVGVPS